VVEDSPSMRNLLCEILAQTGGFEVRCAKDPYEARSVIKQFEPHVVTLDIEMPKMDGITFLSNLMKLYPLPVVMLSTLTHRGSEATLLALEVGAVDFIAKPTLDENSISFANFAKELHEKVMMAANSYDIVRNKRSRLAVKNSTSAAIKERPNMDGRIIAIGASTGGIEAIKLLLQSLPTWMPPIVISQHVPSFFSEKFAKRLDSCLDLSIKQAQQGDVLEQGCVYIAPGDYHLEVQKRNGDFVCTLHQLEKVNMHRPSVDVMFSSLLKIEPSHVMLVLLTGMGKDGAQGMKTVVDNGACSIVQDEETSIVWGMPGSAAALGCAKYILPINDMSAKIQNYFLK
jgi:two-component system chemotaxis response regulator CheB